MKLRNTEYGPIWGASGVQGFFGEGYGFHKLYRLLFPGMFSFSGMTFTAKTMTAEPWEGNLPPGFERLNPTKLIPDCIKINLSRGVVLNAVALSNEGSDCLLAKQKWQRRRQPFVLSFAAVGKSWAERKKELESFAVNYLTERDNFLSPHALQVDFSCPNVRLEDREIVEEVAASLDILSVMNIPLIPKLSLLTSQRDALRISQHQYCDALCVTNALPWGSLPDKIDWRKYFGSDESPLAQYGGGALSGKPLFPLLREWVISARIHGIKKPINAGGGIFNVYQIDELKDAGADSVFIGTVAILRPWRVQALISHAHYVYAV